MRNFRNVFLTNIIADFHKEVAQGKEVAPGTNLQSLNVGLPYNRNRLCSDPRYLALNATPKNSRRQAIKGNLDGTAIVVSGVLTGPFGIGLTATGMAEPPSKIAVTFARRRKLPSPVPGAI